MFKEVSGAYKNEYLLISISYAFFGFVSFVLVTQKILEPPIHARLVYRVQHLQPFRKDETGRKITSETESGLRSWSCKRRQVAVQR